MQKLDYVQHLKIIAKELESEKIVGFFTKSMEHSSSGNIGNYNFGLISPILFLTKAKYEQLIKQDVNKDILTMIGADPIYDENNLSFLTRILVVNTFVSLFSNPQIIQLYTFHLSLLRMVKSSEDLLLSDLIKNEHIESINEGVLIFQVVSDDNLNSEEYIKILTLLGDLVNTIGKITINSEDNYETEIILLDSGSDTNLGIKTKVEIAKAVFNLFSEIWDFIVNFRQYKNDRQNKTLIESLSIITEIQRKVEEGVLTEEEGKEYIHYVKTRTDSLIGLKVLPKQIVTEENITSNRNILDESNIKGILSSGEQ